MSEYAQDFIRHLQALHETDRAASAILRRSLGFSLGAYPPAYPYVERFVASERHAQDASRLALYAVAGLYARHPQHGKHTLATAWAELMHKRDLSPSIEKRFITLLGADPEQLPDHLRQIVSLLAAEGIALDYAALLDDLSRWLNPYLDSEWRDQIRQRWARDFYRALAPQTTADTDASSN